MLPEVEVVITDTNVHIYLIPYRTRDFQLYVLRYGIERERSWAYLVSNCALQRITHLMTVKIQPVTTALCTFPSGEQ